MLQRFEQLMERAVAGSVRRVFSPELQPVQLAKAVARAMEDAQVAGVGGRQVPNSYVVKLSPDDMRRFAEYQATLSHELAQYLASYAQDRGLRMVASPRVELREVAEVSPGSVRVDARFVDLEPEHQAALEDALEGTRQLRLGPIPAREAPAGPPTRAWLSDSQGREYPLDADMGVVRIGRGLDNDVVVASQRVSRYHAQLRREGTEWRAYDLQSTNGTFVGGVRVGDDPVGIENRVVIRLGDEELEFHVQPGE